MKTLSGMISGLLKRDLYLLTIRILAFFLLIPHGFHLVLNYHDSLRWLTGTSLNFPLFLAYLCIVTQFYSGLFLVLGLGSRWLAGLLIILIVLSLPCHFSPDLITDPLGRSTGEGFYFHVILFVSCAILLIRGSGSISVDRRISRLFIE